MTFAPVETGQTLMTAELIAPRPLISFRRAVRADSLVSFAHGFWVETRQKSFDVPSVLFRLFGDRDKALHWRVLTEILDQCQQFVTQRRHTGHETAGLNEPFAP